MHSLQNCVLPSSAYVHPESCVRLQVEPLHRARSRAALPPGDAPISYSRRSTTPAARTAPKQIPANRWVPGWSHLLSDHQFLPSIPGHSARDRVPGKCWQRRQRRPCLHVPSSLHRGRPGVGPGAEQAGGRTRRRPRSLGDARERLHRAEARASATGHMSSHHAITSPAPLDRARVAGLAIRMGIPDAVPCLRVRARSLGTRRRSGP